MLNFILLCTLAITAPEINSGDIIILAERGDLVALELPSDLEARTRWVVQDDFSGFGVDSSSGTLYVSMPSHSLTIDLIIAPHNLDERIQIRRYKIQHNGEPSPEPEPQPTPVPEPAPPADYFGPNEHGIGVTAWELGKELSPSIVEDTKDVIGRAAGHLRGYDGILYIGSEVDADSDKIVFDWMRSKLHPDAVGIVQELEDLRDKKLNLQEWEEAFDEAIQALAALERFHG